MKFFKRKEKSSKFISLEIDSINAITPNSVEIGFRIPEMHKTKFQFLPGQYINLQAQVEGKPIRRSYSICSHPSDKVLKIGIKKLSNGLFSRYANENLKAGDSLQLSPPEGRFVLPSDLESKNIAAFVTGSGITPVISIIKSFLSKSDGIFTLMYGNKSQEETMFYHQLKNLEAKYNEHLKIHWVFSRTPEDGSLSGRIDKEKVKTLLKKENPELFYLCGQEQMTKDVSATLTGEGISKNKIYYELFTTAAELPKSVETSIDNPCEVTIILEGETYNFQLPKKKSILEGAKKNKIDAPYSCQGGVCATCSGRIISGEVEMGTNHVLTDSEIDEGVILTCQSFAKTSQVTISYDDV